MNKKNSFEANISENYGKDQKLVMMRAIQIYKYFKAFDSFNSLRSKLVQES